MGNTTNTNIMGYLRLFGISAIRRKLWVYAKLTMGHVGDGLKGPQEKG